MKHTSWTRKNVRWRLNDAKLVFYNTARTKSTCKCLHSRMGKCKRRNRPDRSNL